MKMAKIEAAMRVTLAFHDALNRHDVPAMMAQHTLRTVKIDPRRVPGGSPVEETL